MDWGASGIRNTYEYERVGFDLETSLGFVDDIVKATISENYDGSYRTCLQVEVDGAPLPLSSLLRVWRTSTLGSESVREEMGTYIVQPGAQRLEFSQGRYTGTVSLQSMLYALDTDKRPNDMVCKAGTNALTWFEKRVSLAKCRSAVAYALEGSAKTFSAAHVWEFGETTLTECQRCADALGGYLTVDTHGRIYMDEYVVPSKRPDTWHLTADDYVDGVGFASPDIVNRVSIAYTYEDGSGKQTTIYGNAQVDDASALSWKNIGRWSMETYQVDDLTANTQTAANAKAAQYLAAMTATSRTLSLTMPYAPIPLGSVGIVEVGGEVTRAVVSTRSIELDTEGLMQLSLKELS